MLNPATCRANRSSSYSGLGEIGKIRRPRIDYFRTFPESSIGSNS